MLIEMASNLSRNAILKGCVSSDFFCLVCDTYFTSSAKCDEHISGEDHEEKLHSLKYVEEFKEDFIVKIKNKYFCELCNILLPIFARVKLHIDDQAHIKKKYIGWLKRIDDVVIAFDTLMVDDTSLQGLVDNSCAICNMEYEDMETHKTLPAHMLNLIQSEIQFDKNKNIYRKVDDNSIHCLICNLIQTLDTNHFDSPQHKQMFQVACNGYKAMKQENDKSNVHYSKLKNHDITASDNNLVQQTVVDKSALNNQELELLKANSINTTDIIENSKIKSTYVDDNKSEEEVCDLVMDDYKAKEKVKQLHHETIPDMPKESEQNKQTKNSTPDNKDSDQQNRSVLDSVDKFQRNGVHINFEAETAVCKKCLMSLDYDHEAIDKHILTHQKQFKKQEMSVPFKLVDDVPEKKETFVSSPTVLRPKPLEKPLEVNGNKSSEVAKDLNNGVYIATPLKNKQTKNSTPNNKDSEQQKRTVLDSVDKFQRNGININFEAQTAVCKKCLMSLDYNHEAIDKHILTHQKQFKKQETSVPFKLVDDVPEKKETLVSSPAVLRPKPLEKPLQVNGIKSSEVAKDLNNVVYIATPLQNKQTKNSTPNNKDSEQQKRTVLDSVDKFQRNGININFEAQTAVCKKCLMSLDYNHEAIDKHILTHQKQFKKQEMSVPFKLVDDVPENKETLVSSPAVLRPEIPEKPLEANSSKSSEVAKDLNNVVYIATPLQNNQTKNSTPDNKDSEQQKRTVRDSVDKFQRNGININFEAQTAVCKKCLMSLDYNHEAIDKHILKHQKQFKKQETSVPFKLVDDVPENKETLVSSPAVLRPEIPEKPLEANSSKSREEAKVFNNTVSIATPLPIETPLSPKLKKTKEIALEKTPAKDFIKTIVAAKNVIFKDVIINNKFCVNHFSFCFITFLVDRVALNCFICDKNISYTEFESHNDSPKHERAMREALVLTQCDQEFIREIRPGCYHCGYCNIFQSSWSEMEKHLKTSFHIDCKNGAFWRLQQYQPQISKNTDLKTIVDTLYANMITVKFL